MIPLCLLTGFLGSGKTSALKHLADRYRDHRVAYLVNDFSAFDVDHQLLSGHAENMVSIPGGSIFCRCLVTEFIGALRGLAERFHSPSGPLEGVVIEASGMANPKAVADMLAETKLDRLYRVASIVSLVDPGTFLKLLHTLPAVRAQVEAADQVLINKTDLFDEARLCEVEEAVLAIRPDARVSRTRFGHFDRDVFADRADTNALHGELAPCRDSSYAARALPVHGEVELATLRDQLERARVELFRAKGFVRSDGRTWYVDLSGDRLTIEPDESGRPREYSLALITRGDEAPLVDELERTLSGRNP